ncbi:hypothetical protein RND71_005299 [Anisodus tanguticus]|uniref:Uncharacterized protein n=1 Tax=Anisodus tanguticus TaxID=243964 RepID=A0AAE1SR92_9SOLA|nr:hypothetical protein RND71_005299 [Anisodus tanguticus]
MQPGAAWEEVKFINTSAELWQWNSPIPYLYCALGFFCAAIAFALFYRFQNLQSSTSVPESLVEIDEEIEKRHQICALDVEPKIVLVFYGNDKLPLYLAKPTLSLTSNASQLV